MEKNCFNVNFVKLNFHISISSNLIVDLFMKGLDILVAVATNFLCLRFSHHIYFFQEHTKDLFVSIKYSGLLEPKEVWDRAVTYQPAQVTATALLQASLCLVLLQVAKCFVPDTKMICIQ